MMKKNSAILISAVFFLTASFSGFSAFAEGATDALPVREMVVIGVDNEEDPKNFFLVCPELKATYYLSESLVTQRLPEGTIEYGDILEFHGEWFSTLLSATNPYQALESSSIEGTYIEITGSVLDQQVPVVYEVESPVSYSVIQLSDGETSYNLCLDYLLHKGYQQETAVDWAALQAGDEITMLTYNHFPCIPAAAESSEPSGTFGVVTHISYDENGDPEAYMLDNSTLLYRTYAETCLGTELPQYGDVLEVGCDSIDPMEPAIFNFDGYDVEDFIRNYGSAADYYGQSKVLTVTGFKYSQLVMEDAEGNQYLYSTSYYSDHYDYVGNLPLDKAKIGDVLTFVMDDDNPVYPADFSPLGDVNADSTLNVLDVVTMNKHLLTGAELPALASASGEAKLAKSGETDLGQCDFNGNGVIDPDDSLCMLKRIVGLETIEVE